MPRIHHATSERLCTQKSLLRHMLVLEELHRNGDPRNRYRSVPVRHGLSLHHLRSILRGGPRPPGRGENDDSRWQRTAVAFKADGDELAYSASANQPATAISC